MSEQILGNIAIVILGIFSLLSLIDKTRRDRSKLASDETKDLIDILQEKITALEGRVTTAENNAAIAKDEAIKVKAENGTLRDILQGRDNATVEFQKSAMDAIKVSYDTNRIGLENSKKLDSANQNIERLAKAIETHLENQAKANTSV